MDTELEYCIEWSLEDTSGNCSPSGSTTFDSGTNYFKEYSEKDSVIEQIIDDSGFNNIRKCCLYITVKFLQDGEWKYSEDINLQN